MNSFFDNSGLKNQFIADITANGSRAGISGVHFTEDDFRKSIAKTEEQIGSEIKIHGIREVN